MKTTFEIIPYLFEIVNVASVTDLIDGRVYRNRKPVNSELKDIVITTTGTNNDYVQDGVAFINIYCRKLEKVNTPDITNLKLIANAVISVLEDYAQSGATYFDFDIISQNIMDDFDDKKMNYCSIRLNYFIERGDEDE